MNTERPTPSEVNLAGSQANPELEQKRQTMSEIVAEAINAISSSDQLDPNQRGILTSGIVGAFIGLGETNGWRWRNLNIINYYYDTINNHNVIVRNNEPDIPLFDLEEIASDKAFADIRNRRRLVKNASQNTLNMLQTGTTKAKDCKDLQDMSKGNEFYSGTSRPRGWSLLLD